MTSDAKPANPLLRAAIDYAPLAMFLAAYLWPNAFRPVLPAFLYEGDKPGIFVGTAVLMPVTLAAVAASWLLFRRVPPMLWFGALMLLLFGGLTLWLHDAAFVKIKLTIIYGVFAAVLLGGLAFGKVLLPLLFDGALKLDTEGWRILTLRWGLAFLTLALLNELVRRTQSDDVWVYFKFPGTLILTFLFILSQVPLMIKHEAKP